MPNGSSKPKCDTCLERGPAARCNRGHPCIWCFNRCIVCRYDGTPPPGHQEEDTPVEKPTLGDHSSPARNTTRASRPNLVNPTMGEIARHDTPTLPTPPDNDQDYLDTLHDTLRLRGGVADEDEDDEEEEPADDQAEGAGGNDNANQPAEPSIEDQLLAILEQQNALAKTVQSLIKKGKGKRTRDEGKHFPHNHIGPCPACTSHLSLPSPYTCGSRLIGAHTRYHNLRYYTHALFTSGHLFHVNKRTSHA
jgi:hypothetical protein